MSYRARIVESEIGSRLRSTGAIVIEGPRAVGKTETARRLARSEVLLDVDPVARAAIAVIPELILEGETPRLIDEWQLEPDIWNYVRRSVDARRAPGQYILTGSATPTDDATRHSGAGRFARIRMRPMSLAETGASSAAISLAALLEGLPARSTDPGPSVPDVIDLICRGGWPGTLDADLDDATDATRSYLEEIANVDVGRIDGVRRDPRKVARFLRAVARHVAAPTPLTTISADAGAGEERLDADTTAAYHRTLERLMLVEDLSVWAPHLRSRSIVRSTPKRHFVDPSLAVAALGATPTTLLRDLNLAGLLFESLVVRDLRIYAQALRSEVLFYRDNTGLEVDAIVSAPHVGRWAAFEVKLGGRLIDDAASSLLRFRDRVDLTRSGEPSCLGVIVATGLGYRRADGVNVVPIVSVGP